MGKPNVVCVSVDSFRADYWSPAEDARYDTTPFLEELGSDATVFRAAISPSSWTLPVHTSVFTGLFPPEHNVLTGRERLGDHPTFAELLSDAGYATDAFYYNGWFDTAGISRGFKDTEIETTNDGRPSVKRRIADRIGEHSPALESLLETGYKTASQYWKSAIAFQQQYRAWRTRKSTDQHAETLDRRTLNDAKKFLESVDDPFCLFVHLNDTHYKYTPPNPFHSMYTDRSAGGLAYNAAWWQDRVYGGRENRLKAATGAIEPKQREVETFKNLYAGGIRYADSLVEELVETLQAEGQWEDTVFVLFGDHGDSFGDDGVYGHQYSVHDSIIRVPLVVRDPTGTLDSGVVESPVSLADLYPTILSLAGVPKPETNAIDLTSDTREYAFSYYDISDHEIHQQAEDVGVDSAALPPAVQYAVWKSPKERLTWYPEHDIVDREDRELEAELKAHTRALETVETSEGKIRDNVADRLKDIGYLK